MKKTVSDYEKMTLDSLITLSSIGTNHLMTIDELRANIIEARLEALQASKMIKELDSEMGLKDELPKISEAITNKIRKMTGVNVDFMKVSNIRMELYKAIEDIAASRKEELNQLKVKR